MSLKSKSAQNIVVNVNVSFSDVIEEEDENAVKSEVKEACVAEAGGEAGEEEELPLEEEDGEASRTSDQITWLSGFQRKYSVMHDLGKGRFR